MAGGTGQAPKTKATPSEVAESLGKKLSESLAKKKRTDFLGRSREGVNRDLHNGRPA